MKSKTAVIKVRSYDPLVQNASLCLNWLVYAESYQILYRQIEKIIYILYFERNI